MDNSCCILQIMNNVLDLRPDKIRCNSLFTGALAVTRIGRLLLCALIFSSSILAIPMASSKLFGCKRTISRWISSLTPAKNLPRRLCTVSLEVLVERVSNADIYAATVQVCVSLFSATSASQNSIGPNRCRRSLANCVQDVICPVLCFHWYQLSASPIINNGATSNIFSCGALWISK